MKKVSSYYRGLNFMQRKAYQLRKNAIVCIPIVFFLVKILKVICQCDKELDREKFQSKKFYSMFKVMDQWMQAKQDGKSMEKGLLEKGYYTIAVYGIHYLGERLVQELEGTQVRVLYAIDKNRDSTNSDLRVLRPDQELPVVDAIIIASTIYFYAMRKNIYERVKCPIISIEEAVEGMC